MFVLYTPSTALTLKRVLPTLGEDSTTTLVNMTVSIDFYLSNFTEEYHLSSRMDTLPHCSTNSCVHRTHLQPDIGEKQPAARLAAEAIL